jgi:putative DNA primase/helicase
VKVEHIFLYGNPPVTIKNAPLEEREFGSIFTQIRTDTELAEATKKLRSITSKIEKKKYKSENLPYILPFRYKELTRNSKYFDSSDYMVFEADHVKDLEDIIAEVERSKYTLFVYTSVSGDGFKFGIKLSQPLGSDYYIRVYNVLKNIYNDKYGIMFDPSSKDLARVQYISHDPNAYYNHKSEPVDITTILDNLKTIDALPREKPVNEVIEYNERDIKRAIKFIRKNGFLEMKDEQLWWELSMGIASLGEFGRQYFILLSEDHPLYPEDTQERLNKRYDQLLRQWGNYHDEERILNMDSFFNKIEKVFNYKNPKKAKEGKKSLELLLADKFSQKFKDQVLFDHSKIGKGKNVGWYIWDGRVYQASKKGEISSYYLQLIAEEKMKAIEHAKEQSDDGDKELGMVPNIETTDTGDGDVDSVPANCPTDAPLSIAQVIRAESRRLRDLTLAWAGERQGLGVLPNEFDQSEELYNCLNGVINLRTGQLLEHSPEYKMTKIAPVVYQKNSKCPNWENFILKISYNNAEIARYIQTAVGYSLTGYTSEQCLFFLYGIGANGKSTFLEGLKLIFGDYQINANYETFTSLNRDGSSHSEDVVRLKGSRLVISSEVNTSRSLNESMIKQITSGDMITARDLHSSSIEFRPTFKLWLAGNHKPKINNYDLGIKRRLFIIPFEYTFSGNDIRPQHEVLNEFKSETSGILNWALEGAQRWFNEKKLSVPQIVLNTTNQYFMENNIIEQFLNERCQVSKDKSPAGGFYTDAKALYTEYLDYVSNQNEDRLGRNSFYMRLEELGYKREISKQQKLSFRGIKVVKNESVNAKKETIDLPF